MSRISRRGAVAREDTFGAAPSLFPFFDDFARADAVLTTHDGVTYFAGYGAPMPWSADNKLKANASPADTDSGSALVSIGTAAQRCAYDIILPGVFSGGTQYFENYLRCNDLSHPPNSTYVSQVVGGGGNWDLAIIKFVGSTPTYLFQTMGNTVKGDPVHVDFSIDASGNMLLDVLTTVGAWRGTATDNSLSGPYSGCDANGTSVLDNLMITEGPTGSTAALVQSAFTDDPGSEVSTLTATFADDVTPGNAIVVALLAFPTSATPVLSGLGAEWHRIAHPGSSDNAGYDLWVGITPTGGDTITVTSTGGNMENVICAAEFSGVWAFPPCVGVAQQASAGILTQIMSCNLTPPDGIHSTVGALAIGGFWSNNEVTPPTSGSDPNALTLTDDSVGTWSVIHDPTGAAPGNSGMWFAYCVTPDGTSSKVNFAGTSNKSILSTGALVLLPLN